ncbi:MAG: hypothetical protein J5860_02085, partial [Clostridia bacterium]|nr:hypothetical protein [Clostridia bacterium]
DEAVADVDLYFRAFKYAFGPYNYMGGDDFFDELHEKILEELNQYKGKNIRTSVLKDIMDKHMAAVQDAHMNGGNKYFTNQYRYTYFYCTDQYYALDEGGFYKLIDGEKWYYVCCDNDVVEMKPTMTQDGKIAYSLVRFCPIADENGKTLPNKNEIVLRNEKTEKKQIVTWIKNKTYGYVNGTDYNFIQENGITYISQRGFIFSGDEYSQALNEYVQAGKKARNSNVIIFDFRSHKGGGSDEMYSSFARGITGKNIEFRQFHAVRRNALSQQYSTLLGKEQFEVIKNDSGHVTKNDIPIIILVDEDCGSGGDEVFCVTRTLENVIVIGSNNGGLHINDVQQYNLPNSGISFNMGGRFWPHYSMENLDGIGNEPDIWCNPADALDIALKMIVNEGLATKAETDGLLKKMPIEFSNDITLKIGNYSIKAGGGFGGIGNIGYVYFKDKIVTDFTVTVLDDTCGNVINDNGKIKIIPKAEGECTFNVYYKNVYATFKCRIH